MNRLFQINDDKVNFTRSKLKREDRLLKDCEQLLRSEVEKFVKECGRIGEYIRVRVDYRGNSKFDIENGLDGFRIILTDRNTSAFSVIEINNSLMSEIGDTIKERVKEIDEFNKDKRKCLT